LALLLKIFLISFNFLFNYFLWNFFLLNTLNYEFNIYIFSIFFFVIFFFIFNKIKVFPLILIFYFNNFYLFFIFLFKFSNFIAILHFFLINFLITNIVSINMNILFFTNLTFFCNYFIDNFFYFHGFKVTLDSIFYETTQDNFFLFNWKYSWTLNNIISFFNHSLFTFLFNNNFFSNFINLNYDLNYSSLFIESYNIENLIIFFVFTYIFFIKIILIKNLNKFKNAFSAPI